MATSHKVKKMSNIFGFIVYIDKTKALDGVSVATQYRLLFKFFLYVRVTFISQHFIVVTCLYARGVKWVGLGWA